MRILHSDIRRRGFCPEIGVMALGGYCNGGRNRQKTLFWSGMGLIHGNASLLRLFMRLCTLYTVHCSKYIVWDLWRKFIRRAGYAHCPAQLNWQRRVLSRGFFFFFFLQHNCILKWRINIHTNDLYSTSWCMIARNVYLDILFPYCCWDSL